MAAASLFPSRCGSAGTSVPVGSQYSATSPRRFWPPTWTHQIFFPRVPNRRYADGWEGREPGLQAAYERAVQRASAGQHLPRSFGIPGVGARLPKSPRRATQEPACPPVRESWKRGSKARNAPALEPGEVSDLVCFLLGFCYGVRKRPATAPERQPLLRWGIRNPATPRQNSGHKRPCRSDHARKG